VRLGHRAVVERAVERRLVHARLACDLAERARGGGRLLDDRAGAVVADVRVERGGRRGSARNGRSCADRDRGIVADHRPSTAGCIPTRFRWLREQGEALGFGSVFSGPLVRSSYRADEQRHAAATGRGAIAF
jgi:hypothetical protein